MLQSTKIIGEKGKTFLFKRKFCIFATKSPLENVHEFKKSPLKNGHSIKSYTS